MKQLSEFILESSRALENKREFVIIKPGFLDKRNDIVEYLKNHNVIITAELRKTLTLDEARKIYKVHSKEDFYKDLCNYMASDDSIGLIMCNYGKYEMSDLKAELRKLYGIDEMKNAVHSSDSSKNVRRESKIYFGTPKF